LVIDDSALVRTSVRAAFEAAGYQVTEAADGVAGLAAYRRDPADLVLCDVFMPDKNGLDVIRELTGAFPGVRIIAMSGSGFSAAERSLACAGRLGAAATIAKPFKPSEALALAEQVLGVAH
jgi:CheY-like chemotaxis protein